MKTANYKYFFRDEVFGHVFSREDNGLKLLQFISHKLGLKKVTVTNQKAMKKDLSARGVCFDILAVDQNHNGYDIEVQTSHEYDIGERFKYYDKRANEVVLKTGQKIKQIR